MKIWFTKGLSNTADAIRLIKEGYGDQIAIHASHTDPDALDMIPSLQGKHLEPVSRDNYAEWVFEMARDNDIDLIVVQRAPDQIWTEMDHFEQAGIHLHITVDPGTRRLLDHKDLFGIELEKIDVPTPAFETFRTLEEFDGASAFLLGEGHDEDGLCIKPAVGIYGSGFRHLRQNADEMGMLLGNSFYEMGYQHFRSILAAAPAREDMMLMQFLPGPERSVDFLARDGEFLAGVARVKCGRYQLLEAEGPAIDMAAELTGRFGLNGICNLQTREDAHGNQHVLEINPRMSGGMQIACMSGVNLPAWDIAAALDLRPVEQIQAAAHGLRVGMREVPRIL